MDEKIASFLSGIARARARALMLDYDGTLAPFRLDPERAVPYPEIPPLLERLTRETDTRLVIVSGRPVAGVMRLLDIPGVEIWGCHGLERLTADGKLDRPELPAEGMQALTEVTERLMKEGLEPFAERKFASIAIHWRGKESMARGLRRRVQRCWQAVPHPSGLRMVEFDGGVEIVLGAKTKGDAVRTILGELGSDAAVAYLGDDTTDEDAFEALKGIGLNVLVRGEYRETLAEVWIWPEEVAEFLGAWIAAAGAR